MTARPEALALLIEAAKLVDRECKSTPPLLRATYTVPCFAVESLRAALALLAEAEDD